MTGHLDIVCASDAAGRSYLRQQSFRAPIHLSKPHLDEGVLVVNVVNPTAGLFAGDRIDCKVRVEAGAALLLTAPSACRAHRMHEGCARVAQEFGISKGGFMECLPEVFIPQGGTRYRQTTRLRVEEGGELLFFESLAPGRVAAGESFEFAELAWDTDAFVGDTQILRERYRITPGDEAVRTLRRRFDHAYYASCIAVSPRLADDSVCWGNLRTACNQDVVIGCSSLGSGGWIIKCVTLGSIALRSVLAEIRRELYRSLERREPSLRRAGGA